MAYPLHVLLELRRRAVDDAEADIARSIAEVTRVSAKLDGLKQAKANAENTREAQRIQTGTVVSGRQIAATTNYRRALQAEAEGLAHDIARLSGALEVAQQTLRDAKAAHKEVYIAWEAVRRHQEAWVADRRSEAAKRAEAALDEIALRQWREANHE